MTREKHFPWLWKPNSTSQWGAGLHLSTVHGHPESLCCVLLQPLAVWPGSDNTNTAHSNPAWKSGQYSLDACAQQKTTPSVMMTASDWTCTMALLSSLQDHFGSWVFLTMVTLQFIQLLKNKLELIPFKHLTSYLCLEQSPQAIMDAKCDFQARTNYSLQIWRFRIVSITEWHHLTQWQILDARKCDSGKSPFKLVLVLHFFS